MPLIDEGNRAKLAMELAELSEIVKARTLAYKSQMAQTRQRLAAVKDALAADEAYSPEDVAEVQGVIDAVDAASAKVA